MAGAPLALAFGSFIAGAVAIDYGVKSARASFSSGGVAPSGASGATLRKIGRFPLSVNPLPGASGSALDQGADGTGKHFLSPWSGHVVVSNVHDPGWRGGGYVAVQSDADPSHVFYVAEGISPSVRLHQHVRAGQRIAYPVVNPYNGIVGNFEAGLANPSSPGQPLAQVIGDPVSMVKAFYEWWRGLGGPKITDWSRIGHA